MSSDVFSSGTSLTVVSAHHGIVVLLLAVCAAEAAEKPPDPHAHVLPVVTCQGWAVGDGKTGQLLWGFRESTPAKAASTTKIMCATVVLQQAKTNPGVPDEVVTFSEFADKTGGSTADIRAGESLKVSECLYGLLLPSGNDAGVALAEHFNRRLAPPDPIPDKFVATSRSNFIAEMNRTARRLGLRETVYRSPFGDGGNADEMTTSPRDLLKLAWTAMQDPRFRRCVCTRQHECDVRQPDGSLRHVVWVNTNRLLKSKGYDGIKTGTTKAAGACLVSSGRLGDDHLILVVLGSKSSDDRYRDTESLFRWAWKQRGHRQGAL